MSYYSIFGRPKTKKQKRREQIEENRRKGKAGEDDVRWLYESRGNQVERTGRGHDFRVTNVDLITGRKTTRYVEVKTGDAVLSPLQRKVKKRKRGQYKEVRAKPFIY